MINIWVLGVNFQFRQQFPPHQRAIYGDPLRLQEVFPEVFDALDLLLQHGDVVEVAGLIELFELQVKGLCFSHVGTDRQIHLILLCYIVFKFLLYLHLRQPLL